jgi:5'-nucleotidase
VDTAEFIKQFIKNGTIHGNTFLNINYPNIPLKDVKGIKYTHLSRRIYVDTYTKTIKNVPDQIGLCLNGTIETKNSKLSDSYCLERSYISITPLSIDSTDYNILNKIQGKKYHG